MNGLSIITNLAPNLPLAVFVFLLIGYAINSLFVIYHLFKFGLDYKTRILAFVFSFGLILLIIVNLRLFYKINWIELMYEYLSLPKII